MEAPVLPVVTDSSKLVSLAGDRIVSAFAFGHLGVIRAIAPASRDPSVRTGAR